MCLVTHRTPRFFLIIYIVSLFNIISAIYNKTITKKGGNAFEKVIARMDRLEGYITPNNPKNFYDRVIMPAKDELVEAYCYVYNASNRQLGEKIADGDFKRYVKTSGKQANS